MSVSLRQWSGTFTLLSPSVLVISRSLEALSASDVPLTPWHDPPGYTSRIFKMYLRSSLFETALFLPPLLSLALCYSFFLWFNGHCKLHHQTHIVQARILVILDPSLVLKSDNNIYRIFNSFSLPHWDEHTIIKPLQLSPLLLSRLLSAYLKHKAQ